ncbi:uncharacterized protein N7469_001986 [Penicillium citrinum]|uniref:Uncharacterized protein n=1 Tax=Penicillium citrinum TaxID=5077 RepID=A0A9W9P9M6_PENCI|nr:uncharacterized protein N7469_001986 [Penicillium citrinum]KAJ5240395.1 hypothetical protein N7469_001986 [Penicillium citrinum]
MLLKRRHPQENAGIGDDSIENLAGEAPSRRRCIISFNVQGSSTNRSLVKTRRVHGSAGRAWLGEFFASTVMNLGESALNVVLMDADREALRILLVLTDHRPFAQAFSATLLFSSPWD